MIRFEFYAQIIFLGREGGVRCWIFIGCKFLGCIEKVIIFNDILHILLYIYNSFIFEYLNNNDKGIVIVCYLLVFNFRYDWNQVISELSFGINTICLNFTCPYVHMPMNGKYDSKISLCIFYPYESQD